MILQRQKYEEKGVPLPEDRFLDLSDFPARRHGLKIESSLDIYRRLVSETYMDTKIRACSSHLVDPVSVSSNPADSANCKSGLWMVESADAEPMDRKHQLP